MNEKEMGAAEERAAVVAFLRARLDIWRSASAVSEIVGFEVSLLAGAIEKGDHRPMKSTVPERGVK